jgi:uncharacterized protein YggE
MKHTAWAGIGAGVLILGLGLVLAASASPPASASQNPIKTSVTVYGTSTTTVTPTKAQVMLGVSNQAATAQRALAGNNRTMDAVVAAVEKLGIAKDAIATSGLSINPVYNQANPPAIKGYQVSDNITINTTVALAGTVIDRAVAQGANQVNGVSFTTPPNREYAVTYRAALKDARAQANAVAASLGEHVLGAKSVNVQQNQSNPVLPVEFAAASAPNTPILPGQQQESISLKVVYELGQ